MTRLTALLLIGIGALIASPATASAQFFGPRFPNPGPPVIVPSFNPFYYVPQYRYQSGFGVSVPSAFGRVTVGSYQFYQGVNPLGAAPGAMNLYQPGSTATFGGSSSRPNLALEMQRDLARAQRDAGLPRANGGGAANVAVPNVGLDREPLPQGLLPALTPAERARVVSGDALNELLAAVAKVDVRAGNHPSAFVSPLHLSELRFAGSDAADLVNLSRQAGSLKYPAAFDDPALKDLRLAFDRDLTAVALAVRGGKAPDRAAGERFATTVQKVEAALAPVIKAQGFEEAIAGRRFLGQLNGAVKALKAGAGDGLVDPKWETQGATVEALSRHMTRHKLTFAPAPGGNEESYTDLHRNLAAYLFSLSQPKR